MRILFALCAGFVLSCGTAHAQTSQPAPPSTAPVAATPAAPIVVDVEISGGISSTAKPKDPVPLKLARDVTLSDGRMIPAGTPGHGEIIHAERARSGGKPGELIIAARYLEFDGQRLPLRGMRVHGNGKDHSQVALGVAVAIGPFAQFIHGGEIEIPPGTLASAKLLVDAPAAAAPADAASSTSSPIHAPPETPAPTSPTPTSPNQGQS